MYHHIYADCQRWKLENVEGLPSDVYTIANQLKGNFMACSCTVAKVNQQQSSSAPAQFPTGGTFGALVLEMSHQGTTLQLVEAHWGALDGLSCFAVVAITQVQTLPTNLDTIAVPNTHLHTRPIAQWEASCSTWNMPAVPLRNSSTTEVSNRPVSHWSV